MTIEIVIPSKHRIEKLNNCINSILRNSVSCKISIYLSDLKELLYFSKFFTNITQIKLHVLSSYQVPDFWNARIREMTTNVLIYLNDDVLLYQDTLKKIMINYHRYFPEFDGLMGLNQSNLNSTTNVEAAFGVIGKNFSKHFKNKQVWCLDYNRFFCDKELEMYAKTIDKFVYCKETEIIHLHPIIDPTLEDDTHRDSRRYWKQDHDTFKKRKALGLLWGRDTTLINK